MVPPSTGAGPLVRGSPRSLCENGQSTPEVEAKDKAGNTASESHAYGVVYDFNGFFRPGTKEPRPSSSAVLVGLPLRAPLGQERRSLRRVDRASLD
jgi:hypothetical protein